MSVSSENHDRELVVEPVTRETFAPFGDLIDVAGADSFPINQGRTQRFHALSKVELLGEGAQGIISIFRGQPLMPLSISMMERHPLGSQAFIPLNNGAFYAVVAPSGNFNENGIRAFLIKGHQGISYHAGTWHAPLLPLHPDSDYLVVDRLGAEHNCDEVRLHRRLRLIDRV